MESLVSSRSKPAKATSPWDAVCRSLGRSPDPAVELAALANRLDAAYDEPRQGSRTTPTWPSSTSPDGDRLKLTPLDRLTEPPSLVELRRAVRALLPKADLPAGASIQVMHRQAVADCSEAPLLCVFAVSKALWGTQQ